VLEEKSVLRKVNGQQIVNFEQEAALVKASPKTARPSGEKGRKVKRQWDT